MRPHSSPTCLLALAALACCSGTAHANDAFDFIGETMNTAFQLGPLNPDDGLHIVASGTMLSGEVVTGVRDSTGEQAILIIEDSYTALDIMGIDPDTPFLAPSDMEFREHVRQVHGTLIGTADVVEVTALSIPDPSTTDGWVIMPTHPDASFFGELIYNFRELRESSELFTDFELHVATPVHDEEPPGPAAHPLCVGPGGSLYDRIPGHHWGALRRFCVCNPHYNCGFAAAHKLGYEPTCNSTPISPGTVDCLTAAQCRLDKCMWAIGWNEMMCKCEKIKADCERYRRKYGTYPTNPTWRGRANLDSCSAMALTNATTCMGIFAWEAFKCTF